MALPASYGFGGAENPLATNWATGPMAYGCKEASGVGSGSQDSDNNSSYWDGDVFNDDQYSQIIATVASYTGASVRCLGSGATGDGYFVYIRDATRTRVNRIDNGVGTQILAKETGQSNANGDLVYIQVVGDTLSGYVGDSEAWTVDDSTYESGYAGVYAFTTTLTFDDWEGGNLGAGATINLLASILGASTTPDVAATIARALLSNIGGVSGTPDVAAIVQRAMLAGIAVQSLTPDIAASVVRALIANIPGATVTPDIAASIERAMTANVAGLSSTPDILAAIARAIMAAIPGDSFTPDIAVVIARALTANIEALSTTPDITITIQGLVNLVANIAGSSITPDVAPTVVRALIASTQAGSATADAVAQITRDLIANVAALSTTPDITATLENVVNLSAAIAGVSLTPDIAMTIARTLAGLITAVSVTPAVTATVARSLIANIQGTSVTPDDLILILAGLGVILDPGIVSVTPRRTFESFGPSLNWPVQLGEGNLGEEPLGEGTARRSRFVIESHTPVFSIEAK